MQRKVGHYVIVLLLAAVLIAAAGAVLLFIAPGDPIALAYKLNTAWKLAASLGCFLAAAAFGRGDYLRYAWGAFGLSYAALEVRDVLLVLDVLGTDFFSLNLSQIVCNTAGVVGFILFARAFRAGGLELPGGLALKAAVYVGAVALAVALSAVALVDHVGRLGQGTDAVGAIASDLGDLAGFALIAPIFLTALALRGGALAWPWFILVAAQVTWIIYDVIAYTAPLPLKEVTRCLACLLTGVAGLAQRRVLAVPAEHSRAARSKA